MIKTVSIGLLIYLSSAVVIAQEGTGVSSCYRALKCPPPTLGTTWAIVKRDGANREVEPYLSSLGQGESGTGVVTSPPFAVASDTITFTVRGHDGQGGGRGENFVALVDARKGKTLLKAAAPGSDALQECVWDVSGLKGTEVRIEIHDGNGGGAFAWLGVEKIDAGPALQIDFRQGMPEGWDRPERKTDVHYELVSPGVPFKRNAAAFTIIPKTGSVELPCGFAARRLFFLGCTVAGGQPLATYGGIEVHYRTGAPEVFPLIYGFTLDGRYKRPSRSMAMYLHASADPYQNYLVIAPRNEVIDKIRLVCNPERDPIPRITAVTCEVAPSGSSTSGDSPSLESEHLMSLPHSSPSTVEDAWIRTHSISAGFSKLDEVMETIRKDNKLPAPPESGVIFQKRRIDHLFRSEGVAVADLDGDGHLDIAAGNVYYAGPDWKRHPLLGAEQAFNRNGYSDAFLCFADDVNQDGAMDLIVVGFPGSETNWLENPGDAGGLWKKHLAVARTGNESPAYEDVDGDGRRELVFMDGGRYALAQAGDDPAQPWQVRVIAGPNDPDAGHGLGIGDVNGDGRKDVLIPAGWWEGPEQATHVPWQFHRAEFFGGAQLCVWDFDGDGDNDVLGSSAHGYGIAWSEQTVDGWLIHEIDDTDSQTHALHLADINGDGLMDFVTGKRFWAHNGHDPGSYQPSVLHWYELRRGGNGPRWIKHQIDVQSGVGLHFQILDVNDDDQLDIITSNKNGVFLFQR